MKKRLLQPQLEQNPSPQTTEENVLKNGNALLKSQTIRCFCPIFYNHLNRSVVRNQYWSAVSHRKHSQELSSDS